MKEKMIQKAGWLSKEGHAALFAKMDAENTGMAVILRDLLTQYVDGRLSIDNATGGSQTKFYLPPDLLAATEAKGRTQGYSFGVLVGRIVDKALVQNHQGETNGN